MLFGVPDDDPSDPNIERLTENGSATEGCPVMKRSAGMLLACLVTVVIQHPTAAQPPPAAPAVEAPAQQVDANAILMRMADYLAKAKSFSVTVDAGYDVVQASGQKIEFGEVRHVLLSRPDNLRVDVERRDGSAQQIRFDGQTVTMVTPGEPFYASLEKPGSVDEVLYYIVEGLKTPIPLALLLVTTVPQELEKRVTEIALVDDETLGGRDVEHLAARTEEVDFQIWIAKGDESVPLRVVITYKNAPGQPQFWADLTNWNFSPQVDKSAFTFVPPADARSVAVMVPVGGEPAPDAARR
jgi:hypothetical protein